MAQTLLLQSLMKSKYFLHLIICSLLGFVFLAFQANSTVVEVRTNLGDFKINLFDEETPETVENFLAYVNAGAYSSNVVHRSAPQFVIQMGGFQFNNAFPPDSIVTRAPVSNEPVFSNRRGTVAMAKLASNPNSATSQFFVNLSNNASILDGQNGGFTVFGQVIEDGMAVVDQISELNTFAFAPPFSEIPLQNYSAEAAARGDEVTEQNVVLIFEIIVTDSARVTNPSSRPPQNTVTNSSETPSSGGGGVFAFYYLIALLLVVRYRSRGQSC